MKEEIIKHCKGHGIDYLGKCYKCVAELIIDEFIETEKNNFALQFKKNEELKRKLEYLGKQYKGLDKAYKELK